MSSTPDEIITPLPLLYQSFISMAITSMVTAVFLSNAYYSAQMLFASYNKPIFQLCFIQSILGAITNLVLVVSFFYFDAGCTFRVFFAATLNLISTTCIDLIMLHKAYYCQSRSKWILGIGVAAQTARFIAGGVNIGFTRVFVTSLYGCGSLINIATAITVITTEFALNLFLSICFISSVYGRWKIVKTRLHSALLTDGLIYFLSTSITSVTIVILVLCQVLGENSAILFNISWAVASKLMVEQLRHASHVGREIVKGTNSRNPQEKSSANLA
ncbi:hypothetical protein K493DRAFT_335553 [Basidiobolus meristosporus CBS 931.73]|uniref:G-protein coupled receptors family 1 profile domain-containing protein n=1 Tax=Basidiobolus meristosporus CBS 931.73 TaxID=1314790 RepID=A0A1Y1YPK3_9FUNG|nr:hypothetical protein K493DRAFT_335553 [Basidiobolus meristosporus CBS 931.73]|eukprot:ORX99932.1 hypothetical protein K493DRAFT_335553 [Basidiobolus meristosporus CBS 931.73]